MATIAQAAAHICCSRAQFDQYLAEGAVTRRPSGQYDLDEVRREAFTHLRSVAAGRGGAAGDKLTAERVALTAAKRRREERQDQLEAGQLARLALVRRYLEVMLLNIRTRLLNLAGETAHMIAMRPQAECFEVLNDAVRAALEEIADPAFAAASAADAGVESKYREVHRRDDDEGEEEDYGPGVA
ncbi:histone H3/H4 [Nitrobacteraceae bacterium AZCC 2146]